MITPVRLELFRGGWDIRNMRLHASGWVYCIVLKERFDVWYWYQWRPNFCPFQIYSIGLALDRRMQTARLVHCTVSLSYQLRLNNLSSEWCESRPSRSNIEVWSIQWVHIIWVRLFSAAIRRRDPIGETVRNRVLFVSPTKIAFHDEAVTHRPRNISVWHEKMCT